MFKFKDSSCTSLDAFAFVSPTVNALGFEDLHEPIPIILMITSRWSWILPPLVFTPWSRVVEWCSIREFYAWLGFVICMLQNKRVVVGGASRGGVHWHLLPYKWELGKTQVFNYIKCLFKPNKVICNWNVWNKFSKLKPKGDVLVVELWCRNVPGSHMFAN